MKKLAIAALIAAFAFVAPAKAQQEPPPPAPDATTLLVGGLVLAGLIAGVILVSQKSKSASP